LQDIVIHLQFI